MVKVTVNMGGLQKKVIADSYYKYCNALMLDVSRNWQRTRYGVPSAYNPSVSSLTQQVKGKDSPMLDRGQLRMSQRVETDNNGKFIIGTDKKYGAILMTGGVFTAKKVFIIPFTREAKNMLRRLQKMKAVMAELRQKYNYTKNKSTVFSNSKGVFLVKKVGKTGQNWTRLFLFRKTIKMPKRQILFFSDVDQKYISNGIKAYLEQ